ncbi:hypothetical protein PVAP13_2KG353200 [Panicum virgatum]|uniref:Uncharacterized protein n=1 Tax=Panicum virgatum TaxID=38727 RepID=A0A8T0WL78_PANVG|nr:hypothetical protein PVAP13_2KG353200 [Panicum virgatum]
MTALLLATRGSSAWARAAWAPRVQLGFKLRWRRSALRRNRDGDGGAPGHSKDRPMVDAAMSMHIEQHVL